MMRRLSRNTAAKNPASTPAPSVRPRDGWRPSPKIRPCLKCGQPRISTSASDRLHPKCRPAGEQNDGEAAAFVGPLR